MLGKVKWLTDVGGYGFIKRSDGPDVFVHYTAIVGERCKTLSEGMWSNLRLCRAQTARKLPTWLHVHELRAATARFTWGNCYGHFFSSGGLAWR